MFSKKSLPLRIVKFSISAFYSKRFRYFNFCKRFDPTLKYMED